MKPKAAMVPDAFSFLIGDWRGKGKQGGGPPSDTVMSCLMTPDGKGVEMIQFDDDRENGRVFYSEHLTIVPGTRGGEMKVTRRGFAYADAGGKLFVTREVAKKVGGSIKISPDRGAKNFLLNNVTIRKEGKDGIVSEGTASAGGAPWSFEFHFKRRWARGS